MNLWQRLWKFEGRPGACQPSRSPAAVSLLLLAVFVSPGARASDETSQMRAVVEASVSRGTALGRLLGAAHLVQREPVGPVGSRPGGGGAVDVAAPGHLRRSVGSVHGRGGALHRRGAAVLQGSRWSGRHPRLLVVSPAARGRRSRGARHPWEHWAGGGPCGRVRVPALPALARRRGGLPRGGHPLRLRHTLPGACPRPASEPMGAAVRPQSKQAPSSSRARAPCPRQR